MIEVFVDGASDGNPGISGGGVYINLGNGHELRQAFHLGRLSSNHEAEFAAMVAALRFCAEKGYRSVSFRTDSQLVNQALEKHYVKRSIYVPYLTQAIEIIGRFDLFFCKWIPDRCNRNADLLARQAIRDQKAADSMGQEQR